MANMSYCRFENTIDDLRDCLEVLDNREGIRSTSEAKYARSMMQEFLEFCLQNDIIEDYNMDNVVEMVADSTDSDRIGGVE